MNDLEICKRIAEIEGYKVSTDVRPSCGAAYVNMYPNNCYGNYDPLTDKALCFDLMVKYDVRVEPSDCNAWIDNEDGYPEHEIIHHDGTLQQAICLAIIKANNNK